MAGRLEDVAGIVDAYGVVGRGVHDQQGPAQGFDAVAQIGGADVLDEVAAQGQSLAPDRQLCFALGFDAMDQRVVDVLDVRRLTRCTDADHRGDGGALVRGRQHRRPAERMTDQQSDLTSGFVHELHGSHRVGDLVRERTVTPVAGRLPEAQRVEAQHPDALAGQLLADSAGRGTVLAQCEPVYEDPPPAALALWVVDEARQGGSTAAGERDALCHAHHPVTAHAGTTHIRRIATVDSREDPLRSGAGAETATQELPGIVDRLEAAGVDSLWFSEVVYSQAVDPFIGMAFALSRTTELKVGTSVAVLPGRQPVLVAKQLASLASLAPKRVLPVFGLRSALPAERGLFAVPAGRRGAVFDEALTVLRAALDPDVKEPFAFQGTYHDVRDVQILPKPATPLDIWLGGASAAGYRRVGTHGDGWLGSFLTPEETADAHNQIVAAAGEAGRSIPADHYGINLAVGTGTLPGAVADSVRRRRPDLHPTELVAEDWRALHAQLDGYLAAGLTKFVIRPAGPVDMPRFLDRFVRELLPRQN